MIYTIANATFFLFAKYKLLTEFWLNFENIFSYRFLCRKPRQKYKL